MKTETRLHAQPKAAPPPSFTPVRGGMLQRKCACGGAAGIAEDYEGYSKNRLSLQRSSRYSERETRNSGSVPQIVHEVLSSPGQPLDRQTRAFMEPRFGHDFGKVRVHTDSNAAESAGGVNALAYTVNHNVVFGAGQYEPTTAEGRRLLAHELAHVIQQGDRQVKGGLSDLEGISILRSDSLEREADNWGDRISRSGSPPVMSGSARIHPGPATSGMRAMQLQDDPKAPLTQTQTPLEQAQALIQGSPATAKDRAAWILKAADQSFVTFNTTKARQNLENVRDEKQVENLDPKAAGYDVPILEIEVGLARKIAQRWIDAKGVGSKPSIQFGSMIRSSATDVHGQGKAIDINALGMTTSVDMTIVILNDLDKSIHTSYGLGLPFQGDFFDPADNLDTKKKNAEGSATPLVEESKTEAGGGATNAPNSGAKPAEKTEAQPVTATADDAVKKFASHIYQSKGTKGANGKWKWTDSIQVAGGAYTRLKSQTLKETLASRRKDGFSFMIFPDNDNHLHLDAR